MRERGERLVVVLWIAVPPSLEVQVGGKALLMKSASEIRGLYLTAFAAGRYPGTALGPAEFDLSINQVLSGRCVTVAVVRAPDGIAGFCYGYELPADHGWWTSLSPEEEMGTDFWKEWEGRTHTLQDLAIRADYRRVGLGKRLMASTLSMARAERAVVSIQPTNLPSIHMCVNAGWQQLGVNGPLHGVEPPFWNIYWKPLRSPAPLSSRKQTDHDR